MSHYTTNDAMGAFFLAMREADAFAARAARAEGDAREALYRQAATAYRTVLAHVPVAKTRTRAIVAESVAACLTKAGDARAAHTLAAELLAAPNLTPDARDALVHHLTPYLLQDAETPCEPSP